MKRLVEMRYCIMLVFYINMWLATHTHARTCMHALARTHRRERVCQCISTHKRYWAVYM